MDRGTWDVIGSFERHLHAENRAENTVISYLVGIRQFESFLAARGRRLLDARREDAEAFLGDLLRRHSPGTAAARFGWPLHIIEDAGDDPAMEQPATFMTALRTAL